MWTALSGLASIVHADRGDRIFKWVWRVLFIVNATIWIASMFFRAEAA